MGVGEVGEVGHESGCCSSEMGNLGVACELEHRTGVSTLQSIQGHSCYHLPILARSLQRFVAVMKDESAPQPSSHILSTVRGYETFEKEA